MSILQTAKRFFTSLVISLACVGQVSAVVLTIDLDSSVSFFVNPNPNYTVNINLQGSPITVNPGDDLEIWIDFIDLDGSGGDGIGARQHLEVFDLPEQIGQDPNPPQDLNVFLLGSIPSDPFPNVSFNVMFSHVMGSLLEGPAFSSTSAFCFQPGTIVSCSSGVLGTDLTNSSFLYHDFHINFESDSQEPLQITEIGFGGAADRVEIGTWPIPEPASLGLYVIGLMGLIYRRSGSRFWQKH